MLATVESAQLVTRDLDVQRLARLGEIVGTCNGLGEVSLLVYVFSSMRLSTLFFLDMTGAAGAERVGGAGGSVSKLGRG